MKVLVIGSGLSAYGATLALLKKKNLEIDIVDIGLKKQYKKQPNLEIPNSKDVNGSFYPYGINDKRWPINIFSKRICSSHAYGGFSKVYSGSILRPKVSDLTHWPKDSIPSNFDYEEILDSLKVLQSNDNLNKGFPIDPYKPNESPKKFNYLGRSRIAYSKSENNRKIPFDSSIAFKEWESKGLIKYIGHSLVEKISPNGDYLDVFINNLENIEVRQYKKVYLGAGCINSTVIVDKSLYDMGSRKYTLRSAPILFQLYFKFPFLRSNQNVKKDLSNYCEYFLEAKSNLTKSKCSNKQIGRINQRMKNILGSKIGKKTAKIIELFTNLFKFSISVFHSSLGPAITIISEVKNDEQFISINESNFQCGFMLSSFIKKSVLFNFKDLGLLPIPFSGIISNLCKGNFLGGWHYGGSLPMKNSPKKLSECNPSGEVKGIKNLFIVDSSTFPSIPGSSVALLIMANSYRISKNSIK